MDQYKLLQIFGNNIIASEHDEWKRFKRIWGPLFSEPNNRLVWNETVMVMNDLFTNVWGSQKQVVSEHALELTKPVCDALSSDVRDS